MYGTATVPFPVTKPQYRNLSHTEVYHIQNVLFYDIYEMKPKPIVSKIAGLVVASVVQQHKGTNTRHTSAVSCSLAHIGLSCVAHTGQATVGGCRVGAVPRER